MSNWSELPKEILWNVFSSFQSGSQCASQKDLAQCALTCRFWRTSAQAIILSEINLRSESDLKNLTNIMFENNSLRNWVKTLKFVDGYHNKCGYTELLIVSSLFPNLKNLELYCDSYRLYNSFSQIIKLIDHQAWDRTSLYQALYNRLDRFSKLKHITIDTLKPINFKTVTEYLESITNNNSSTTLQKTVITSVDESDFFSIRTTIDRSNTIAKTIVKALYITMNEENCEMIPSKSFMQYIMRKYPSNDLDCFRFENIGLTYKHTSVSQSTFSTLVQFIDYICKVPNHYFKNIFLIIRCDAVPLVKAYCKHTLQNSESKSMSSSLSLVYKSRYSTIINEKNPVEIGFERISSTKKNTVYYTVPHEMDSINKLKVIKLTGRFYENMSFQADSPAEIALFADYISKYCAKLVDLTISKFASMSDEVFTYDTKSIKNYTVKKLTWLRYIPFDANFVSYMLNRLPNLKTLVFADFHMENGVCKTSSMLPTRLPHTISFDTIEINMMSSILTKISYGIIYCLKVITEEKEKNSRCCFLRVYDSEEHVTSYSEVKKPFLKKEEVITFVIYCRSVKKISVKYTSVGDGVRKQIDL